MSAGTLLVRADASLAMGTGHVMRCLALAQAWQDAGGRAAFALSQSTSAIQRRLEAEFCEVVRSPAKSGTPEDASQTNALAEQLKAQWIVVDGYQFGSGFQELLKQAGNRVLFLDDFGHAGAYVADLILNQNVTASAASYAERSAQTRLLLGARYALLRREFHRWQDWERSIPPVCRRLLVTMGGSDPQDLTSRVIEAVRLVGLHELDVTILIGGGNQTFSRLQEHSRSATGKIEFLRDVSDMGSVMAAADTAVSAAGTTCVELCLLGLPSLLIDAAENQTPIARELDRRKCAIHIGDRYLTPEKLAQGIKRLIESQPLRESLSIHARRIVDGNGARRVVSVLCGVDTLRIRAADAHDERLLWEWVNDPEVREASFSKTQIPWEDHVAWFGRKLHDPETLMLIAMDETDSPIGQVRFDLDGPNAVINISLAPQARGHGLGVRAIQAAVRELFAARNCQLVHAYVKRENAASATAFRNAEFSEAEPTSVRGCPALHFVLNRG